MMPARNTSAVKAASTIDSASVAEVKEREPDADEGQRVVDDDEHHQHRQGAEDVDEAGGDQAQRLRAVEPRDADQDAGDRADEDRGHRQVEGVDEAAQKHRQGAQHHIGVEEGLDQPRHGQPRQRVPGAVRRCRHASETIARSVHQKREQRRPPLLPRLSARRNGAYCACGIGMTITVDVPGSGSRAEPLLVQRGHACRPS